MNRAINYLKPTTYRGGYGKVQKEVNVMHEVAVTNKYLLKSNGERYKTLIGLVVDFFKMISKKSSVYDEVPYIMKNGNIQTTRVPLLTSDGSIVKRIMTVTDYSNWIVDSFNSITSRETLIRSYRKAWDEKLKNDMKNMTENEFFEYYGAPKKSDVIETIVNRMVDKEINESLKITNL